MSSLPRFSRSSDTTADAWTQVKPTDQTFRNQVGRVPDWAVLLLFFGMRHPAIYDPTRLGSGRTKLAAVSLVIFLLSFTLAPIAYTGGF